MNRLTVWKNSVRQAIETYDCDYKPFGELDGGDEPTKHGFATAEYDGESSCFAMGMRMYSAELGRFLSVDPLFEAMPRHTPYHYSFNSPLIWRDPSGLIPENEKDRDRLMERVSDDDLRFAYETYYESGEELQRKSDEMSNFFIATKKQLEWMVNATDYLSSGYESSMIDGTLNVLYGRTGGSGSGDNGEKRDRIPDRNLGKLKDSDMDSFADLTKDLDEELREKTKVEKREWGYFLTLDKEGNLWARFITSAPKNDPHTWMSFSQSSDKPPFDVPDGESFLGFNHTHTKHFPKKVNQFSINDWGAFQALFNNSNKKSWKFPADKSYMIIGVITSQERQFIKPTTPVFQMYQYNMMMHLYEKEIGYNGYGNYDLNPNYYFNQRTGFQFKIYKR